MTAPISALRDLEKRLSEASVADPELDAGIAVFCGLSEHEDITSAWGCGCSPRYTSSIDDAVALCERALPANETADHKKSEIILQISGSHTTASVDRDTFAPDPFYATARTPALALCLAIVRALLAQSEVQK